jgi:hypothetical protein
LRLTMIRTLAAGQDKTHRISQSITCQMNLGREAAATSA